MNQQGVQYPPLRTGECPQFVAKLYLQEIRREVTQNFGFLGTNADQADLTDANPISNHDDSET